MPKKTAPKQTRKAVVYTRISADDSGHAAGVERQMEDCVRYCKQQGWRIVIDPAETSDNDKSASRYAWKRRPKYDEVIKLAETGQVDAVVAYHLDRLWRQPKELEHLIDLAETTDVEFVTLTGPIDLRTGDGIAIGRASG